MPIETIEIPVSIGAMRAALVVIGLIVFLLAWNTEDRVWSLWYWFDRIRGGGGDIHIGFEQRGGLKRGKYIIMGIVMVLLGIFGGPWLKTVAELIVSAAVQ
jgi:hypothetical protein